MCYMTFENVHRLVLHHLVYIFCFMGTTHIKSMHRAEGVCMLGMSIA